VVQKKGKIKKVSKKNSKNNKHTAVVLIKSAIFIIFLSLFIIYFARLSSIETSSRELMSPSNPRAVLFLMSLVFTTILLVTLLLNKHKSFNRKTIDVHKRVENKSLKEPEFDVSKELKIISRELRRLR